jgi:hypothetical protein
MITVQNEATGGVPIRFDRALADFSYPFRIAILFVQRSLSDIAPLVVFPVRRDISLKGANDPLLPAVRRMFAPSEHKHLR